MLFNISSDSNVSLVFPKNVKIDEDLLSMVKEFMFSAQPSEEKKLLKTVLAPLLDDFVYWLDSSLVDLEKGQLSFMSVADQKNLMERIRQTQAEVGAAKSLFEATNGNVGLEVNMMIPWHQLVSECWQVAQKRRQLGSEVIIDDGDRH